MRKQVVWENLQTNNCGFNNKTNNIINRNITSKINKYHRLTIIINLKIVHIHICVSHLLSCHKKS